MGQHRASEDRWFPRYYDIVGPCPVTLQAEGLGALACRIVDVSRDGLGLVAERQLQKDMIINLEINERKISLQVVHCNEDLIHKGHFRVGLRRIGSADNLVNLFAATGCIRI